MAEIWQAWVLAWWGTVVPKPTKFAPWESSGFLKKVPAYFKDFPALINLAPYLFSWITKPWSWPWSECCEKWFLDNAGSAGCADPLQIGVTYALMVTHQKRQYGSYVYFIDYPEKVPGWLYRGQRPLRKLIKEQIDDGLEVFEGEQGVRNEAREGRGG